MNLFIKYLIKIKKESKKSNLLCYNQSMNFNIRINRLSQILELLNKGYELSTPNLVERFGVTKKIIQSNLATGVKRSAKLGSIKIKKSYI